MFQILSSTDSTNNYAMGMVHAGLARHGMACFANEQTSGKGQQGKAWNSQPGQNILMSILIRPPLAFLPNQFYFNLAIANTCYNFFKVYGGDETTLKWPNDIYWRDRKAGGVLIENKFSGINWKWAVVGIGINVNQVEFNELNLNAVSLKQITGTEYDPLTLAKELYSMIMTTVDNITSKDFPQSLASYNEHLYKTGETVSLKKENAVFKTMIKGVNEFGQLLTLDTMARQFNHGEVEWIK